MKATKKLTCLCCGKTSPIKPKNPYMSGGLAECGYCGYEHIVEVRAGKIVHIKTTG